MLLHPACCQPPRTFLLPHLSFCSCQQILRGPSSNTNSAPLFKAGELVLLAPTWVSLMLLQRQLNTNNPAMFPHGLWRQCRNRRLLNCNCSAILRKAWCRNAGQIFKKQETLVPQTGHLFPEQIERKAHDTVHDVKVHHMNDTNEDNYALHLNIQIHTGIYTLWYIMCRMFCTSGLLCFWKTHSSHYLCRSTFLSDWMKKCSFSQLLWHNCQIKIMHLKPLC